MLPGLATPAAGRQLLHRCDPRLRSLLLLLLLLLLLSSPQMQQQGPGLGMSVLLLM
jgi:energy-coupling factor transporter transmembrane protein EcfT